MRLRQSYILFFFDYAKECIKHIISGYRSHILNINSWNYNSWCQRRTFILNYQIDNYIRLHIQRNLNLNLTVLWIKCIWDNMQFLIFLISYVPGWQEGYWFSFTFNLKRRLFLARLMDVLLYIYLQCWYYAE